MGPAFVGAPACPSPRMLASPGGCWQQVGGHCLPPAMSPVLLTAHSKKDSIQEPDRIPRAGDPPWSQGGGQWEEGGLNSGRCGGALVADGTR